MRFSKLPGDWQDILHHELEPSFYAELESAVTQQQKNDLIYPPDHLIFQAFTLCPVSAVQVVILGQDPYHGPGQAMGLAFSVPDGIPIPPSLQNIYKEIQSDIGTTPPASGNLTRWAKQGVLLLNTTLTVVDGQPGAHTRLGWNVFTDAVVSTLAQKKDHIVFLLWGNHARSKKVLINTTKHLVREAPHPSPLSAHRGFFGCKHFSQANDYLRQHAKPPIDW